MDSFSFRVVQDKNLRELLQRNQTRLADKSRFVLNQESRILSSDRMKDAPPPKKKLPDAATHLLQTLERFPCLWNTSNGQYCNKNARRSAYQQMARQLNIAGDNFESKVRGKINAVKEIYISELVKINRSKRFTHNVYKSSLAWFDLAHKILGQSVEKNFSYMSFPSVPDDSTSENSSVTNSLLRELEKKSQISTDDTEERPTKRKRFSLHSDIDDTLSTVSKSVHFDDEFEIFGRNVACHLRKLSEELALESQSFIQSYLIEQRLKNKNRMSLPTENGMENSALPTCSSALNERKSFISATAQNAPEPMDVSVEAPKNIPVTKEQEIGQCKIDNNVPEIRKANPDGQENKDSNGGVNVQNPNSEFVRNEVAPDIFNQADGEPYISMQLNLANTTVDTGESKCNSSSEISDPKEILMVSGTNEKHNLELIKVEESATNNDAKDGQSSQKLQNTSKIEIAESQGEEQNEIIVKSYSEPTIEDNLNEFITIRRRPSQLIAEDFKSNVKENSDDEEEEDEDENDESEEETDDEIIETVYGDNDESDAEASEVEEEQEVLNIDTESEASPKSSPEKNYVEMKPSEYSSEAEPYDIPFSALNNGSSKYDSARNHENLNKMYIDSVPVQLSKMISVEAADSELPEHN